VSRACLGKIIIIVLFKTLSAKEVKFAAFVLSFCCDFNKTPSLLYHNRSGRRWVRGALGWLPLSDGGQRVLQQVRATNAIRKTAPETEKSALLRQNRTQRNKPIRGAETVSFRARAHLKPTFRLRFDDRFVYVSFTFTFTFTFTFRFIAWF
jgi:hypothetical protein